MTEQQRLAIRAELARRMGWTTKDVDDARYEVYRPNGKPVADVFGSGYPTLYFKGETRFSLPFPDPFTNAADKDALVKGLAADDTQWRSFFRHFSEALELDFDVEYPGYCAMLMMTASCETITLAAARALGIGEAESGTTETI